MSIAKKNATRSRSPCSARWPSRLRLADARDDVRSILVTGAGANFCAGHDLDSFSEWPQALLDPVPTFLHTIADVRKPVVIAVHGSAVGIAVTWLLHADWVVTSAATTFRLPFIDLGIAPEAASTILLKGAVGIARARRLLLGGEKFTGAQAFDWGLVAEVVEFEDVVAAGWRRAAFLASKDPLLLRQIKDWLHPAQAVSSPYQPGGGRHQRGRAAPQQQIERARCMKQAHIVYAHPEANSFVAAMRDTTKSALEQSGWQTSLTDLQANNFKAVASAADFGARARPDYLVYSLEQRYAWQQQVIDAEIASEAEAVRSSDLLVLVFPVFWFSVPALMKGWIDRVFLSGVFYGGRKVYDRAGMRASTPWWSAHWADANTCSVRMPSMASSRECCAICCKVRSGTWASRSTSRSSPITCRTWTMQRAQAS